MTGGSVHTGRGTAGGGGSEVHRLVVADVLFWVGARGRASGGCSGGWGGENERCVGSVEFGGGGGVGRVGVLGLGWLERTGWRWGKRKEGVGVGDMGMVSRWVYMTCV